MSYLVREIRQRCGKNAGINDRSFRIVIIMTIGLAAQAAWLIMHGEPVELATAASTRLYGPLSYAVGSCIALPLARLWAKRREMWRDVFIFRRPT